MTTRRLVEEGFVVESIQLMRQIAVKAVVTESFKAQVTTEIGRNLQQIDAELQQLEFKGKRAVADLERKGGGGGANLETHGQIEAVRGQMEAERARLRQLKEELEGQSKTVAELPLGSVVTQFTVESAVDVRIGENIFQRLEGGEILIKDGVIQEIRI
jgi:uncharacterized coiled-coil DUF342 family protein